jgi:hypothetical protein
VPALTFGVSTNFALANFLASRSIRNVSVALAYARFPCGSSNETYHVPWDLLVAMIPSRELRRRHTGLGRSPLATCRISPAIFPDLVVMRFRPVAVLTQFHHTQDCETDRPDADNRSLRLGTTTRRLISPFLKALRNFS